MGTNYGGSRYLLNGFIVLDIDYTFCTNLNYNSFSLITSYDNENIDVNIWHTRLCHIGQHKMHRLAKEGLLAQLKKLIYQYVKIV